MKKRIIFILAIIVTILSSCNSGSGHRKPSIAHRPLPDSATAVRMIDSLNTIIAGLTSSEYDVQVKALKKLPEFQHAIFMTHLETEQYMSIFAKLKDKYAAEAKYYDFESDWESQNDTTLAKRWEYGTVKIVYDTTQSLVPIASLSFWMGQAPKDKRTKKEQNGDMSHFELSVFYLKKYNLCYVVNKETSEKDFYLNNIGFFDKAIRSLK